jgi:DNA uptake protein ComE-like DNA-binding protein
MVLIPLLLVLTISEPMWRWWKIKNWTPSPSDLRRLDSLAIAWRAVIPDTGKLVAAKNERFVFDPNTASEEEFKRLGFNQATTRRIINYRTKGGVFRTNQDLLKIYGIDSAFCNTLTDLVKISSKQTPSKTSGSIREMRPFVRKRAVSPVRKTDELFNINDADTARFEAVRGIGEKLSRRIVKYRSALGGFVVVGQLSEVFGLDSMALSNLTRLAFIAPDFLPDRMDLNMADEAQLEAHPYISRQEARAIVAYRFQHGRFTSVSDLVLLPIFAEEKVRRLEPYLKIVK